MKFVMSTLLAATFLALPAGAEEKKETQPLAASPATATNAEPTQADISYAVGMIFNSQLKRSEYDFNLDEVFKGMKEAHGGAPTRMTDQQAQQTIQKWQMDLKIKQDAKRKLEGEANKKKGEAFLAENAKKPNVKVTGTGLQYEVLTEGTGKIPSSTDTVQVHYSGTLIDGTEFDSSRKRDKPAEFAVTGVIRGWTEALQMMKVGSRWKLTIPAELAYGETPRPSIPANSVLVFDVELLEVKEKQKDESVQAVSGEIIKVPSAEELKKGAKIEVLNEEDVRRLTATNSAATNKPATKPK